MANNNSTPKSDRSPFKRVWFWVTIGISFVCCIFGLVLMIKVAINTVTPSYPTSGFTTGIYEEDDDDDDWYDWYEDEDEDEEEAPVYNIGETARIDDIAITVTSVTRNFSTGNRYDTPDDGMEYVKVNLTISNPSKNRIDYSPFDFELENGDGDIHSYATSLQDDHIGSGSLVALAERKLVHSSLRYQQKTPI